MINRYQTDENPCQPQTVICVFFHHVWQWAPKIVGCDEHLRCGRQNVRMPFDKFNKIIDSELWFIELDDGPTTMEQHQRGQRNNPEVCVDGVKAKWINGAHPYIRVILGQGVHVRRCHRTAHARFCVEENDCTDSGLCAFCNIAEGAQQLGDIFQWIDDQKGGIGRLIAGQTFNFDRSTSATRTAVGFIAGASQFLRLVHGQTNALLHIANVIDEARDEVGHVCGWAQLRLQVIIIDRIGIADTLDELPTENVRDVMQSLELFCSDRWHHKYTYKYPILLLEFAHSFIMAITLTQRNQYQTIFQYHFVCGYL